MQRILELNVFAPADLQVLFDILADDFDWNSFEFIKAAHYYVRVVSSAVMKKYRNLVCSAQLQIAFSVCSSSILARDVIVITYFAPVRVTCFEEAVADLALVGFSKILVVCCGHH